MKVDRLLLLFPEFVEGQKQQPKQHFDRLSDRL
jgi:hypothetical protein